MTLLPFRNFVAKILDAKLCRKIRAPRVHQILLFPSIFFLRSQSLIKSLIWYFLLCFSKSLRIFSIFFYKNNLAIISQSKRKIRWAWIRQEEDHTLSWPLDGSGLNSDLVALESCNFFQCSQIPVSLSLRVLNKNIFELMYKNVNPDWF